MLKSLFFVILNCPFLNITVKIFFFSNIRRKFLCEGRRNILNQNASILGIFYDDL